MRTRFQMLSIIFLFILTLVACSGGNNPQLPSSITVPPTTLPTTHPQLVVDVYEPNSILVTPTVQLHGGLGTSYVITFVIHATDYSAGIMSINEQTSATLNKRFLASNGTCLGQQAQPNFGSPSLYHDANAIPGGTAQTDVLTRYNFDLAANALGWDTLDATIAITVLNGHSQSATFTGSIHWDKPAPC